MGGELGLTTTDAVAQVLVNFCYLNGETRHIPFQLWNLAKLLATLSAAPALFGGGLLWYVMYDLTDYYLHHANPTTAVTKNLEDKGFGVTSSLWDSVWYR
ncbi:unnamed protein product [Eruca vesicaria subsp. sativa]|uniref:Uncharacterized protein n=1 Tax=Eruca vesicaria subsp. sativa TaxID=29727 RepID=A0ABC8IVF3_ERUVS|nr:unnamed protein product [Eruca vesicaria subsp. sativa]